MDPVVGCDLFSVKSFILSYCSCMPVFTYIVTDDCNRYGQVDSRTLDGKN